MWRFNHAGCQARRSCPGSLSERRWERRNPGVRVIECRKKLQSDYVHGRINAQTVALLVHMAIIDQSIAPTLKR